ncbi:CAP domain-containing protein, partial [Cellulomonas iranensis]
GDGAAAPAPAAEPEPPLAPAAVASADDPGAAMAADVVTLTNERRAEAGLAPLGVSACATEQAVARAGVLVAEGRFEHDPLGPVLDACRAGTVGENLSLGYPSAQAAVAGWMGSPGHRENILRASYAQVGVGCVPGGRGWLCAQVFVG